MFEDDLAIIKALVPVAWADGVYNAREQEMIEALLEAYGASDDARAEVRAYAAEKKTLDDIELSDLSGNARRTVLRHAVLLSFIDGAQADDELALLKELAARLRIGADEAQVILAAGAESAKSHLDLL